MCCLRLVWGVVLPVCTICRRREGVFDVHGGFLCVPCFIKVFEGKVRYCIRRLNILRPVDSIVIPLVCDFRFISMVKVLAPLEVKVRRCRVLVLVDSRVVDVAGRLVDKLSSLPNFTVMLYEFNGVRSAGFLDFYRGLIMALSRVIDFRVGWKIAAPITLEEYAYLTMLYLSNYKYRRLNVKVKVVTPFIRLSSVEVEYYCRVKGVPLVKAYEDSCLDRFVKASIEHKGLWYSLFETLKKLDYVLEPIKYFEVVVGLS